MGRIVTVGYPISKVGNITINTSRKCNISQYDAFPSREIKYIVMHYTGNYEDTAAGNANYFMGANRNASAHYFVDDNSIWQSVGVRDAAWHCGAWDKNSFAYHPECRNMNSVGIEMCCTAGNYDMSAKTVELSAQLCAALCKYLNITDVDKYVVRHYDVSHKSCPRPMVQNTARWTAFRNRVKEILKQSKTTTEPKKVEPKATQQTNNKEEVCKVELRKLYKGMSGNDVRMAMLMLKDKGYYKQSIPSTDNLFGNNMEAAVLAFQKAKKIDVDGVIGVQTWTKLLSK